jgi:hypothetical protein
VNSTQPSKRQAASAFLWTIAVFARRSRGTAVVEFAILVPVLLLIVLGIVDFGRSLNYVNDATHIASEGARFAVVNKNPGGSVSLQDWLKSQADTDELRKAAQVCVTFPSGTSQIGQPVKVTVSFTFNFLSFIGQAVGGPNWNLSSSSTMRIEVPPSASPIPNYSAGCSSAS